MAIKSSDKIEFGYYPIVSIVRFYCELCYRMGCGLHQHAHGHSHGGDEKEKGDTRHKGHSHDVKIEGHKENINVKAAFIHVIGDFVQSIGVFIAALIIFFKPEWKIIDPICTFIFSVLVLCTTLTILRNTMNVLMEGNTKITFQYKYIIILPAFSDIRNMHNDIHYRYSK